MNENSKCNIMRIGLDFDGVIVDHSEHKIRLSKDMGFELEPWQTNTNIMKQFVPEPHYKNVQEMIYTFMTPKAPPIAEALERIRGLGGELYIVSARRPTAVRFAHEWMDKHEIFGMIPAERVYFCGNSSEKGDYCRRLGIEAFLDDKLSVLEALDSNVRKFLFDSHGAVEQFGIKHDYRTVGGWKSFTEYLQNA